jgi:hypothetical protein
VRTKDVFTGVVHVGYQYVAIERELGSQMVCEPGLQRQQFRDVAGHQDGDVRVDFLVE